MRKSAMACRDVAAEKKDQRRRIHDQPGPHNGENRKEYHYHAPQHGCLNAESPKRQSAESSFDQGDQQGALDGGARNRDEAANEFVQVIIGQWTQVFQLRQQFRRIAKEEKHGEKRDAKRGDQLEGSSRHGANGFVEQLRSLFCQMLGSMRERHVLEMQFPD